MNRLCFAVVCLLGFVANQASAVDIKNIRACYGPFGATRTGKAECLPGDKLWITYDIEGLVVDPKTKKVTYETTLELLDSKNKTFFKDPVTTDTIPAFGGTSMPGDLHVNIGKQPPGEYSIRLTIHDKVGKDAKTFSYPITVVADGFGMIEVSAQAVGILRLPYAVIFKLVNLKLDGGKQPKAEVSLQIFDDKMKPVNEKPITMMLPRDLPDGIDLEKLNMVVVPFPLELNRAGRFTIEVKAIDKLADKKIELRYPLTVIDVGAYGK
ncbi:MAG: hypothetical protein HYR84_14015 [Planctomycetes bacterium]|nr:hypothetical protein [Planctomycetota bacterium]